MPLMLVVKCCSVGKKQSSCPFLPRTNYNRMELKCSPDFILKLIHSCERLEESMFMQLEPCMKSINNISAN